jgi:hypothetical protein
LGCRGTCFCFGQCTVEDELVGIRVSRWGLQPLAYVSPLFGWSFSCLHLRSGLASPGQARVRPRITFTKPSQ